MLTVPNISPRSKDKFLYTCTPSTLHSKGRSSRYLGSSIRNIQANVISTNVTLPKQIAQLHSVINTFDLTEQHRKYLLIKMLLKGTMNKSVFIAKLIRTHQSLTQIGRLFSIMNQLQMIQ